MNEPFVDIFHVDQQEKRPSFSHAVRSKLSSVKTALQDDSTKFEVGVLLSKFGLILGLLIIFFINADTFFISKEPRKFLAECSLVGGTAIASSILLGKMRGASTKTIANGAFIAFLVFFIFHLLMEMSGLNNLETKGITTGDAKQQKWVTKNLLNWYVGIFLGIGALGMMALAARVQCDKFDESGYGCLLTGIAKKLKNSPKDVLNTMFECLLFAMINASPSLLITKNRGFSLDKAVKSFKVGTAMYSALYLLLEAGGFWGHAFGSSANLHDYYGLQ